MPLPTLLIALAATPAPSAPAALAPSGPGWAMTRLDLVVHVLPWEQRAVREEEAAAVTEVVEEYEASFVAVGRTLAEIINLPAKVFTKMIWLHNMMEVTEGPVSQPMKDAYGRFNAERDEANERYEARISPALRAFERAVGG